MLMWVTYLRRIWSRITALCLQVRQWGGPAARRTLTQSLLLADADAPFDARGHWAMAR
jgi:hypothetical protein